MTLQQDENFQMLYHQAESLVQAGRITPNEAAQNLLARLPRLL